MKDKLTSTKASKDETFEIIKNKINNLSDIEMLQILEQNPCAIIITNTNGTIEYANPHFFNLTGYTKDEVIGKNPRMLKSGNNSLQYYKNLWATISAGKTWRGEFLNKRKNGELFWEDATIGPIINNDGLITHYVAIKNEITNRKQTENSLQQNKKRLQKILNSMYGGVVVINAKSLTIEDINDAACKILGKKMESLIGSSCCPYICSKNDGICPAQASSGKQLEGEVMIHRPDGTSVPILKNVVQTNIDGKDVLIETIFDISQRRQTEANLKRSIVQNQQLLHSISSCLILMDEKERIVFLNKKFQETFFLDRKKTLGKNLMQSGIQWQWDKIVMAISECRLTRESQVLEDISYEVPRQHTSGFLKVTISPYLGSTGEYPGFLILAEDITEYKILQSQLSQAQKLESIGQLAAGIAHEINTPIQFVGDNTRFLKDAFSDVRLLLDKYVQLTSSLQANKETGLLIKDIESQTEEIDLDYLMEEIPSAIEQTLNGINRVAKIVKAMKEFSHPGNEEKTPIDLNKAIANTIIVCRNEWKYVAEMQTEFADNLPPVPCFPAPLNQVILNLIINASHTIKDALTERGEKMGIIKISTKHKNKTVLIAISDTGMGIPEEIQKRIFDPFFTTKEVGKGTGQGLAISFDVIVKMHKGALHFSSVPGQGSTFFIELPLEMEQL